jgi:hypothetical protein
MALHQEEAPGAGRRTRAQEMSACSADTLDNTTPLITVQATRLLRRFNISGAVAHAIAELAFENGRAMR